MDNFISKTFKQNYVMRKQNKQKVTSIILQWVYYLLVKFEGKDIQFSHGITETAVIYRCHHFPWDWSMYNETQH